MLFTYHLAKHPQRHPTEGSLTQHAQHTARASERQAQRASVVMQMTIVDRALVEGRERWLTQTIQLKVKNSSQLVSRGPIKRILLTLIIYVPLVSVLAAPPRRFPALDEWPSPMPVSSLCPILAQTPYASSIGPWLRAYFSNGPLSRILADTVRRIQ